MRYFKLPSINRQRNRKPEPDLEKLFAIPPETAYPEKGLNKKQITSISGGQEKTPIPTAENTDSDQPDDRERSIPEPLYENRRDPVVLSGDPAGKTAAVYPDTAGTAVEKHTLSDPGLPHTDTAGTAVEKHTLSDPGLPHTDTAASGIQWGENSSFVSNISKIADLSQKQLRFLRRTHDLLKTSGSEKYYS